MVEFAGRQRLACQFGRPGYADGSHGGIPTGELVMNIRRWWVAVLIGMFLLSVRSSAAEDSKSADEAFEKGKTCLLRERF